MAEIDNAMLAERLLRPAQLAGRVIMEHYARDAAYALKADASPVTEADRDSEEIILDKPHGWWNALPVFPVEVWYGHLPLWLVPGYGFCVAVQDGAEQMLEPVSLISRRIEVRTGR